MGGATLELALSNSGMSNHNNPLRKNKKHKIQKGETIDL